MNWCAATTRRIQHCPRLSGAANHDASSGAQQSQLGRRRIRHRRGSTCGGPSGDVTLPAGIRTGLRAPV